MAQVDKSEVKLCTLGGLQLEGRAFGRTKPLLVLAYLCLEGKQARRRVAELFWPHAKDPLASLSTELSRLKKACGEIVESDDTQVWATVPADAGELLEKLERPASQSALQQALEAYEGPFLSGVSLNDWSAELENWVYSTREFLAGRVCEAHVQRGEAAAKEGRFSAGARCAKDACAVLGSDGLDPELMPRIHALLRADEHPHAANVARAAQDFGLNLTLTPAEARTRLRPAARPLPTRGTPFIGRHEELAAAEALFAQGERLLSVVGLAGMGKTRLALQVANRMIAQGHFRDGVDLVRLESLTSPGELPYRLAATLGIELKGELEENSPVAALAAAIGDGARLLVFDNFEHLMDEVMLLPELLERCPNLALLVTSRERLNLAEEFVLWLEGLPFEDARSDALTLFVERAKRHRQGFDPSERELGAIARICRAVGGSPLATELAAALVNVLSCEQIAEHLAQDLISLSSNVRNLPERQMSIEAAFESSWRLLSEGEQRALMGLAVFRGGFSREAAQKVAGVGLSRLVTLGDKALLRPQPDGRYDRHPLLYEFTRQRLLAQPELAEVMRQTHAAFFNSFLEERLETIRGEGAKTVLEEIGSELDNIRASWDYQLERGQLERGQVTELARGVFTLALFFEFSGRAREGLDLFAATLERLTSQPGVPLALGKVHYVSSWMFDHLGQTDLALQAAEKALAYYRSHGDDTLIAHGLNNLAVMIADHQGVYKQAAQLLEEARTLISGRNAQRYEANLFVNLGVMYLHTGDYTAAERSLSQGKQLHITVDNRVGIVACLHNQGHLFTLTSRLSQAESSLEEGLALSETLRLEHFKPHFCVDLARLRRLRGDSGGAYEQIALALEQAQQIDHQQVMPDILVEYARVDLARGERGEALTRLDQALAITSKGGMLAKMLHTLAGFSEALLASGEHALALKLATYVECQNASYAADRDLARRVIQDITSADETVRTLACGLEDMSQEGSLGNLVHELRTFRAQQPAPDTAPASPPQSA